MITFKDEREAELWRSVYAAWIASRREYTGEDNAIVGVSALADDVVLEYRHRCGVVDGDDVDEVSELRAKLEMTNIDDLNAGLDLSSVPGGNTMTDADLGPLASTGENV